MRANRLFAMSVLKAAETFWTEYYTYWTESNMGSCFKGNKIHQPESEALLHSYEFKDESNNI